MNLLFDAFKRCKSEAMRVTKRKLLFSIVYKTGAPTAA
jgi:hypothetical protein